VDLYFQPALAEAPEIAGSLDRLRRALGESDLDAARAGLAELEERRERITLSPQAARSFDRGITELSDAVGPDAYWRAPTWKRLAAIAAGPGANVVLSIGLFAVLFATGGGKATTTVDSVVSESPAAEARLQPGDRIVEVNRIPVDASEISERINASSGRPITLTVARDGEQVRVGPVRPRLQDGRYRVGFVLRGEGLGVGESLWEAVHVTGLVTKEIGAALGRLVTGEGREEIASPVGIVQGSSTAAEAGTENFLWVLGLISLSLALLNLLPLLPLDGGHIAFSLVEGVRGKAVAREVYERVSVVGIALVLLLFFIGLSNDIGRLGS
jgi:regulator of sigma E protease